MGGGYDFECECVFAVLPEEVAEEDDDEIVVGPDEAAEEAYELGGADCTTMASMVMSR